MNPEPIKKGYVVDPNGCGLGEGYMKVTQEDHGNVANRFGQVKYAHREGATSIYKDETRNTANDNEASAKAEGSCVGEDYEEGEESQGI